ncbi:MAG: glycosyltransferase family 4 protein, partial [Candidatus Diapherotrites archaeon]|nr:glycosyltransferase family 4 protein [Candidatus Diapherotrites archaeon]
MKVLHLTNHFWPSTGGIEKFTLDLCRESIKMGIESEVLCLNKANHSSNAMPSNDEIDGIRITRVPFLDLKYYKPAFLPLKMLSEADVLHVHGVSALLDFAVLTKPLHGTPIVVSSHGGLFHTKNMMFLKKAYFFGFERLMLHGVDQMVSDSKNDFELFRSIAPKQVLIVNGVDLDRFQKCAQIPKRNRTFLFVGRLSQNKRIENLLAAFEAVHQAGIDFELRIVGEDWEGILPLLSEKA